jgi:hypothetical protein
MVKARRDCSPRRAPRRVRGGKNAAARGKSPQLDASHDPAVKPHAA